MLKGHKTKGTLESLGYKSYRWGNSFLPFKLIYHPFFNRKLRFLVRVFYSALPRIFIVVLDRNRISYRRDLTVINSYFDCLPWGVSLHCVCTSRKSFCLWTFWQQPRQRAAIELLEPYCRSRLHLTIDFCHYKTRPDGNNYFFVSPSTRLMTHLPFGGHRMYFPRGKITLSITPKHWFLRIHKWELFLVRGPSLI